VHARLDPLGLDAAPPVIALADLTPGGGPLGEQGVHRIRLESEHRDMRTRWASWRRSSPARC
jgi:hypothetical protein